MGAGGISASYAPHRLRPQNRHSDSYNSTAKSNKTERGAGEHNRCGKSGNCVIMPDKDQGSARTYVRREGTAPIFGAGQAGVQTAEVDG